MNGITILPGQQSWKLQASGCPVPHPLVQTIPKFWLFVFCFSPTASVQAFFFSPFIPMPFSPFRPPLCPYGAFQCQSCLHSFIHILATSTSPVASPLLPPVCATEVATIGSDHRIWKVWLEHPALPLTVCVTLAELNNHATSRLPSL